MRPAKRHQMVVVYMGCHVSGIYVEIIYFIPLIFGVGLLPALKQKSNFGI